MPPVVFVHGIAQEQLGPATLGQQWRTALSDGVWKSGAPAVAERLLRVPGQAGAVNTQMVFYADLFDPVDVQGGAANVAQLDVDEAALLEQLAEALLRRAAEGAGSAGDQQMARDELAWRSGSVGEEQGVRNAARSALAALARLRWFAPFGMAVAQRFVARSLMQVTRYLTDPGLRTAVQERVAEQLGPDTQVVIGHSLGSVVAYEAVCRPGPAVPLLITLGSPLGLRSVIYDRLRPQPPRFPDRVIRWVNVSAEDDVVAAVPDLTTLFAATKPALARFEGGVVVENGTAPHAATHYLTKREVGRPVADVLGDAAV